MFMKWKNIERIFSKIAILGALFTIIIICKPLFSFKENHFFKKLVDLLIYQRRHLAKLKSNALEFESFLTST